MTPRLAETQGIVMQSHCSPEASCSRAPGTQYADGRALVPRRQQPRINNQSTGSASQPSPSPSGLSLQALQDAGDCGSRRGIKSKRDFVNLPRKEGQSEHSRVSVSALQRTPRRVQHLDRVSKVCASETTTAKVSGPTIHKAYKVTDPTSLSPLSTRVRARPKLPS